MAGLDKIHTQDEGGLTLHSPQSCQLCANERGASMLEYVLLASLIAVAAISSVDFLGEESAKTFLDVGDVLMTANSNH